MAPPRHRCWLDRRRARNENLLVMSLIQGLCGLCAIILSSVSLASAAAKPPLPPLDKAACLVSGLVMLVTSVHGVVTSRRKTYCTVLALLVLCILSCIANASLLLSCACGLYHFVSGYRNGGTSSISSSSLVLSDLVISILLLLIGLLDLGVAVACGVLCGRQVCRHDPRIGLHPGGRGLIILQLRDHLLPPPPPAYAAGPATISRPMAPPPLPPLLLPLNVPLPPQYSSSYSLEDTSD